MEYLLSVQCTDRPGLIADLSARLFAADCTITENGEFVDREEGIFFMRTAFEGECDVDRLRESVRTVLPDGAQWSIATPRRKRLALLATKEPHCLGDLLLRCAHDELHADIVSVTANHAQLRGLVERFDVPFQHVDAAGLEREVHEALVREALAGVEWDYLVMAKYMRILSPAFVDHYAGRIVNIHHSFLPAFIGAHPYRQAHQRGVKIIGATAHFATRDLDEGPIIAQGVQPVSHAHSVADLSLAGKDIEKTVLAKALRLLIEGRVFVYGNRTILFE